MLVALVVMVAVYSGRSESPGGRWTVIQDLSGPLLKLSGVWCNQS